MFTGIVEETGTVLAFRRGARAWRLRLSAALAAEGTRVGDSIAVNGCCLTVAAAQEGELSFDVLAQTRRLTNFAALRRGAAVNLERSLRPDGRMGGHFVSGHIDGTGRIEALARRGRDYHLTIRAPAGGARYLVPRGSIALDGISLTVAEAEADRFAVWIIPHTFAVTCLRERRAGDAVNLEFDLLAKYVENLTNRAADHANRPRRPKRRTAPAQSVGRRVAGRLR